MPQTLFMSVCYNQEMCLVYLTCRKNLIAEVFMWRYVAYSCLVNWKSKSNAWLKCKQHVHHVPVMYRQEYLGSLTIYAKKLLSMEVELVVFLVRQPWLSCMFAKDVKRLSNVTLQVNARMPYSLMIQSIRQYTKKCCFYETVDQGFYIFAIFALMWYS